MIPRIDDDDTDVSEIGDIAGRQCGSARKRNGGNLCVELADGATDLPTPSGNKAVGICRLAVEGASSSERTLVRKRSRREIRHIPGCFTGWQLKRDAPQWRDARAHRRSEIARPYFVS